MGTIIRLALPLTIWLAAFSVIYGLNGWLCATEIADTAALGVLVTAVLLALITQVVLIRWLSRTEWNAGGHFVRTVALTLSIVALIGTGWTLLPGLVLSRCM